MGSCLAGCLTGGDATTSVAYGASARSRLVLAVFGMASSTKSRPGPSSRNVITRPIIPHEPDGAGLG